MSTMTDTLIEINRNDLPTLQKLFRSHESKNDISYMTLGNYIGFFEQDPSVKHVNVYCLNGDFSDGTFVITDRNRAYADTLNASYEKLSRLLQLIDYSKGYIFLAIRPEIRPILKSSLRNANVEIISDNETILYHLPKEEALKFNTEAPKDIELHPITKQNDLEKLSKMWIHQDASCFPYIQRLTKYNPNVGAFKNNGTLVAWILRLPVGLLGGLETDQHYYGHGYGSLVTRVLASKIAQMGDDVYAAIYLDNIPSHSLFKKLGFKPVGKVYFVTTKINWSSADE